MKYEKNTGVGFLDHMLDLRRFDLMVYCRLKGFWFNGN